MLPFLLLLQPNSTGPTPVAGGGAFLLLMNGGGNNGSGMFQGVAGGGAFLLTAQGAGFAGSGLPNAQISNHPDFRVSLGITL